MLSTNQISHKGVITHICNDYIQVQIEAKSACSSCQAKSSCHVSEMEEKIVQVKNTANNTFSIGDNVTVYLAQNKGFEALFFGYLLPFIILFTTLILALQFTTELRAGLASLLVLIPYYTVLYFSQKTMRQRFSFQIESL